MKLYRRQKSKSSVKSEYFRRSSENVVDFKQYHRLLLCGVSLVYIIDVYFMMTPRFAHSNHLNKTGLIAHYCTFLLSFSWPCFCFQQLGYFVHVICIYHGRGISGNCLKRIYSRGNDNEKHSKFNLFFL